MLITSNKISETNDLPDMEYQGDKVIFHHRREVSGTLLENKELRKDASWNGKGMKHLARIDPLVFFSKPELQRDAKALYKFIHSEEGAPWVVQKDQGTKRQNFVSLAKCGK